MAKVYTNDGEWKNTDDIEDVDEECADPADYYDKTIGLSDDEDENEGDEE